MVYANWAFIVAGLLLEAFLALRIFRQGLARRLQLFVALLSFYAFREVVLYTTVRHISRGAYADLGSGLALADVALQLMLAAGLFLRVDVESSGRPRMPSFLRLALGLLLASLLTLLLTQIAPAYSPVPVDRTTLLSACFFLVLSALSASRAAPSPERMLLRGFTLLAVMQVAAQLGKASAAAHRQAGVFLTWAYFDAVTWLAVLLFWIVQLRRETTNGYLPHGTA